MCCSNFNQLKKVNMMNAHVRSGFSLIEMMVVLAIIGMLTAAVSVNVYHFRQKGQVTTAEMEINNIVEGLEQFNTSTRRYPSDEEGLEVLFKEIDGFAPILVKKGGLVDPWGNPYAYRTLVDESEPYEVSSAGLDLVFGSEDDISNLTDN